MDIFKNGIIRFYVMQTSKTCCARVLSEWREFFGDAVFPNQRKEEFRQGKHPYACIFLFCRNSKRFLFFIPDWQYIYLCDAQYHGSVCVDRFAASDAFPSFFIILGFLYFGFCHTLSDLLLQRIFILLHSNRFYPVLPGCRMAAAVVGSFF